jgi:uncharacterized protein with HEPN domain
MKGMLNRMAHGYIDRDLDVVWDTVQTDLPEIGSEFAVNVT